MLDVSRLGQLVRQQGVRIAEAFRGAAETTRNKQEFQTAAAQIIADFARTAGVDLSVQEEHTLINGRADAVYNRFIIEYERPGSLRDSNSHGHNQRAIGQVKEYLSKLVRRERHKAERLAGVVFNGDFYIWVRQREKTWHIDQPVKVDPASTERFLRTICSLSTERALIPENLIEDFGENTSVARRVVPVLYDLLTTNPPRRARVLFEQWSRQFSEVCDYEQASKVNVAAHARAHGIKGDEVETFRFFFCVHTYYAYLIKLLALRIVQFYLMPRLGTDLRQAATKNQDELRSYLANMEDGGVFRQIGINNLIEADMFGWYLDVWCERMAEAAREVINTLANYAVDTLDIDPDSSRDLLKHLYQNLIPKALRHNLGEYYTPDWLAERTLALLDGVPEETVRATEGSGQAFRVRVYRGDPHKRLLDPACGSGTFLVMAIRRIKEYARRNMLPQRETLRLILQNVVGFDLNPLAVLSARTNYLLSLGELLRLRGTEGLNIPVYMCDSILTPTNGAEPSDQGVYTLSTAAGAFSVPAILVESCRLRALVNLLEDSVSAGHTSDEFRERAGERFGLDRHSDGRVIAALDELYGKLRRLKAEGIKGMWARLIQNAFAPLIVGRFDFVAGNPPWVNWEHLPQHYREATKPLWKKYGLFTLSGWRARMGGGKKDLSMLMFHVAVDNYLEEQGKIGLVITQTVFKTEGGGEGFRRFRLGENGAAVRVLWLDDLSGLKPFEGAANRTAVMVAQKGSPTRYPVVVGYWRKRRKGVALPENASLFKVLTEHCSISRWQAWPIAEARPESPWITGCPQAVGAVRRIVGPAAYQAREACNSGGLNGAYWVEVVAKRGEELLVVSNCGNLGKIKVPRVERAVEAEAVYPLLRGEDVSRWRAEPSLHIVLAQDETAAASRALDEKTVRRRMPYLYDYFLCFERRLRQRSAYKKYLSNQPFYAVYNCGKHVFAPWKVVWKRISNALSAAVLGDPRHVPDNAVVLVPCHSEDEAHYICGLVNSAVAGYLVASFSVPGSGTWGSPKLMQYIPIARFDRENRGHRAVATLSRRAHLAASRGQDDAAAESEAEIDELSRRLWGLSRRELRAIQKSLRELGQKQVE